MVGFPFMNPSRHACCVATFFLTVAAQQLHALPVLQLFDGTSTLTILGVNPIPGPRPVRELVSFVGTWGDWNLNISGSAIPYIYYLPHMVLNFDVTSSGVGGTLVISLSDNDFGRPFSPPPNTVIVEASGSIAPGGSASYEAFRGYDNVLFSNSLLYGSSGPRTGNFSYAAVGPIDGYYIPGLFSLTQTFSITHAAGPAHSTGRGNIVFFPERGLSISLFAMALLGIGAMKRRFSRATRPPGTAVARRPR
jgi:hypothetical protein